MDYPKEVFEEVFSTQEALDELLKTEADLHVFTVGGFVAVHTCYGDICKIVCALMNYASLMELISDQWDLTGLHRISYESQAKKLRKIADKLQKCIGYVRNISATAKSSTFPKKNCTSGTASNMPGNRSFPPLRKYFPMY